MNTIVKVGQIYKTYGGWDILVIHLCCNDWFDGFYAIHKPLTEDESPPIYHYEDGSAHTSFSVNEPPRYQEHLPADIILEVRIK